MKTKLFALLMVIATLLPLTACGGETPYSKLKPSEGLEFEVYDEYCKVVDIGTCKDTEIVIPASYEGKPVTSIGSGAFRKYNRGSDDNYVSFTKIHLPETVDYIGDRAFWGCDALEEVHIYAEKIHVCDYAFWECSSLTNIDLTKMNMNNDYVFDACGFEEFTINEGTTTVGEGLLIKCTSLKSLTIPASVSALPRAMCQGCTNLTDVYYGGTKEQWSKIDVPIIEESFWDSDKVYYWDTDTGNYTVHCSDGDITK